MTDSFPQPLDHAFSAPIEKDGAYATYLTVPGWAELLGTKRAVKVSGTIDGHPFHATLMPSGRGSPGGHPQSTERSVRSRKALSQNEFENERCVRG